MTGLENWLERTTHGLSKDSAAQVRREIGDHYEAAREAAMAGGAAPETAERSALNALGDAQAANRQYRRVLLTSSEARLLRNGNVEAKALCAAKNWLRWPLLALSLWGLAAAAAFWRAGAGSLARVALAFGIGIVFWLAVPLLPVYTPLSGRVFRGVKWVVQAGALLLAFGPGALRMYWLIGLCLWQLSWTEWKRASIRRKLPSQQWPKHLYL
jgi:hypothetical protein